MDDSYEFKFIIEAIMQLLRNYAAVYLSSLGGVHPVVVHYVVTEISDPKYTVALLRSIKKANGNPFPTREQFNSLSYLSLVTMLSTPDAIGSWIFCAQSMIIDILEESGKVEK
jgi:hypothetical protein